MAVYYPHRQTILIALLCALAVGATIAYVHWQTPNAIPSQGGVSAITDTAPAFIATSTDWQKEFFGSSTGTTTILGQKTSAAGTNQPNTLTDQFSRDFFARYVQLQQNGLVDNQQLQQDTIDQTIDDTLGSTSQAKAYGPGNLKLSADVSQQALHTYGNQVGSILINYMPKTDAATIANDAFNNNDMSSLSNINTVISAYQNVISRLLAVQTPQPLIQYHLNLVNAISSMSFISQDIKNVQDDPMQSMVALGSYGTTEDSLTSALLGIKNYLATANVIFASNEPGSLFAALTQ